MTPEELMIGDWVIGCSEEPFKIGIIDPDFKYWNELHPIPLTPEILEKNGFVLKHDGWLWCEEEGSEEQNYIFIQFRKGCDEVRIVELNFVNNVLAKFRTIQFVHELQHALKLCGITKEIVL